MDGVSLRLQVYAKSWGQGAGWGRKGEHMGPGQDPPGRHHLGALPSSNVPTSAGLPLHGVGQRPVVWRLRGHVP